MDYKGKETQKGSRGSKWLLMKIRIVSWNVRGANEKNKSMVIKAFVLA